MSEYGGKAYANVKDQVGYCGIWCGSCVVGNGALRELAERFGHTMDAYGLRAWAPASLDYDGFARGLAALADIPVCPGCVKGGGRARCEIRACASERELQDCTECEEFGACRHAGILETMRSGAVAAGLSVRTGRREREELLTEWMERLSERWPCCVLFHPGPSPSPAQRIRER